MSATVDGICSWGWLPSFLQSVLPLLRWFFWLFVRSVYRAAAGGTVACCDSDDVFLDLVDRILTSPYLARR